MLGRAGRVGLLVALLGWFVVLRPQSLGGPAAYVMVAGDSMEPTLQPGSLVVVLRRPDYRVGDVVTYRIGEGDVAAGNNVIHRIVGGDGESGYVAQGDNVASSDPWHPTTTQIVGKVVFVIPGAAPALIFLRSPLFVASVATGIALYLVLGWRIDPPRKEPHGGATEAG